ncbi:Uma2 family endonuclease [Actinomadura montaniterrae]|uniref:Uma2 family endonuclease n=1 Tax=Actinomadura montaniterrae TaxID=1803903 RepID=A0A6L3VX46_9ACTN|nr:Uma2 family endonuclease [Actinomadura montaniterrae]KAB2379592.1 Uma2 family endonuclease [Actinomadura montaniterrae]
MTTMVHEPESQRDVLLDYFLSLDPPEGHRAELIDGEIFVSPPLSNRHDRNNGKIVFQVALKSSTVMEYAPGRGISVPGGMGNRTNMAIPDATFAPRELNVFDNEDSWLEPDGVCMVVEVTSSRPQMDREAKRYGYARAGIPLYLLVDRGEQKTILFGEPDGRDYGQAHQVQFGKGLALPEPFGFELDTAEFA